MSRLCKNIGLSIAPNDYLCLEADTVKPVAFLISNMAPVLRVFKKVI